MKITTIDKPNTTKVSDTDGKDDESINKDEIEPNMIQLIEKMMHHQRGPGTNMVDPETQQIYHTIIKE